MFRTSMSKLRRIGRAHRVERRDDHRVAGDAARQAGDWAGAATAYQRHVDVYADDFAIWVQLGHAHKESGNREQALAAYNTAYRLSPKDADLILNLGHLYKLAGNLNAATRCYLLSADIDGNVHARIELEDAQLAPIIAEVMIQGGSTGLMDPETLLAIKPLAPEIDTISTDASAATVAALRERALSGEGAMPVFDPAWYIAQAGEEAAEAPFAHYVDKGAAKGLWPHPLFDPVFYVSQMDSALSGDTTPLEHFLTTGARQGADPHRLFDSRWYVDTYGGSLIHDPLPFIEFLDTGWRSGRDSMPLFSVEHYRRTASLPMSAGNPLIHYVTQGDAELRRPCANFSADRVLEVFGKASVGSGTALELYVAFIGRDEIVRAAKLDQIHVDEYGILPDPLARIDMADPAVAVAASVEMLDNALGGKSKGDGMLHRFGAAKLELLRRDRSALHDLATGLSGAPDIDAVNVIAASGLVPLRDVRRPARDDFPATGLLERYRRRQLALHARFSLVHDRVGAVQGGAKISVLLPIYRAPVVFLERAIQSVLRQTYANWELCFVDDCSKSPELAEVLAHYAALDPRIKGVMASVNKGIAGATNRALENATGDYVALLDHDDMLTHDAFELIAKAIDADPTIDWLYSDECKIGDDDEPGELMTKPDWSPMLLTAVMYTGHLTVYRTSLVRKIGGFRSAFDFSQDYDLALRIAETDPKVHHVSEILYGWRMIAGSAAVGDKPTARLSNIGALQSAMDRRGWPGEAVALPTANRALAAEATTGARVSIIIPSDNARHICQAVMSIIAGTSYDDYEVLVVTNSRTAAECGAVIGSPRVRFVPFDKPYNFSAKCNAGGAVATGDYLIFHNDDVLVISSDWIQAIIEPLRREGVGAVAPKLLYENARIQHGGMVTGVRKLFGTAFHTYPRMTNAHMNYAQSVREVSILCGACVAIGTPLFRKMEGWDEINAPIAHSDVDFCFRVRELGYSCVYTPHAELTHIGHVSRAVDPNKPKKAFKRAKEDIFSLKRFPEMTAYDPYFPAGMRDVLYVDSQEPFNVYPAPKWEGTGEDILIVSHDLTNSGAPRVVYDMAVALKEAGHFVVVLSETDGPMRERLQEQGITVIIDSLALTGHPTVRDFVVNFDKVIANTIVAWRVVEQLSVNADIYWYIHETALIDEMIAAFPAILSLLASDVRVLAATRRTARYLKTHRIEADVLETASEMPTVVAQPGSLPRTKKVRIGVFGTLERRKGQDIAASAFALIDPKIRRRAELIFFGRSHDRDFEAAQRADFGKIDGIVFGGEAKKLDYWKRMMEMDIVLVPSRDDALPMVSSDALALAKTVVCSDGAGVSDYVEDGVSAYVFASERPQELANLLEKLIVDEGMRVSVRDAGRAVFDRWFTMRHFRNRLDTVLGLGQLAGTLVDAAE